MTKGNNTEICSLGIFRTAAVAVKEMTYPGVCFDSTREGVGEGGGLCGLVVKQSPPISYCSLLFT